MYHLGKLVLLPNFGAVAFCRKHLTGLPSGDQNSVLWGRPCVHCIGLSLLAKLIPVGSLAGVADPGLAIARLSLVWRLLVPGS